MRINFAAFSSISICMIACSGGGGGGGSSAPAPSASISGVVSAGPVNAATVKAYALNSNGSLGSQIATATSDSSGKFTLSMSAQSGPVIIVASGGSYVEEASGATISMGNAQIRTSLPSTSNSQQIGVTPVTEIATQHALATIAANGSTSLTAIINKSNATVALAMGLSDITKPPADPAQAASSASSTQAAQYAVVLAAISQMAKNASTANSTTINTLDVMQALAITFTYNGSFNSKIGSTDVPVPNSSGATISLNSVLGGATNFNLAMQSATTTVEATLPSGFNNPAIVPAPTFVTAPPPPVGAPTVTPPTPPASLPSTRPTAAGPPPMPSPAVIDKAYQDKLFILPITSTSSATSVIINNGPSWLSFNSATNSVEGVPNDNVNISGMTLTVTTSSGVTTLGPYNVTVMGDPLKKYAWHMTNTGQTTFAINPGTAGQDINISQTVKSGITGNGVKVAISDSGLEIAHEDLAANIISGASRNYTLSSPWIGDPTPTSTTNPDVAHGTAVAGIIGAVGWNNIGTRGIAPNSKLAGFRFIDTSVTQTTAIKVDQALGTIDIFNYSYGSNPYSPPSIDQTYISQLQNGTTTQRSGKGSVYVKSAGNSFLDSYLQSGAPACYFPSSGQCPYVGNSNFGGAENAIPDVIIAGALNAKGQRASYSSPGSNLWVSSPGGEFGDTDPAIISSDLTGCNKGRSSTLEPGYPKNSFENSSTLNPNCKYTSIMNGTSSAAPVTTGAIALILETNPNLTLRDIKYILATTATKVDPNAAATTHPGGLNLAGYIYQQGWVQNSAGFWFHNWYGFGRVNVDAAIALAKLYSGSLGTMKQTTSPNGSWIYSSGAISQAIPDNSATGTTSAINVRHNYIVEGVQVQFTTNHPFLTDLGVELTSPSGTKSILLNINSGAYRNSTLTYDAQFLSNAFLGEASGGNWTLKVVDGYAGGTGSLLNWQINVMGHLNPAPTDTTVPLPITNLSHAATFGSTSTSPSISWTPSASGDLMRYEVSIGTSVGATDKLPWTSAGILTTVQANSLVLVNGTKYYVNVRAVDTSENVSAVTSSSGWIADTSPPAIPTITSHINNSVVTSTSVTLVGTCEPGSTVNVTPGSGVSVTSSICDSSGVLTIVLNISGSQGPRSISVTLTDAAGNTSGSLTTAIVYLDQTRNLLATGDNHACSVSSVGAALCWGNNTFGQIGDGTLVGKNVPTAVSSLISGVLSVAAGSRHSCALLTGGTIKCWGYNADGQLGNGNTTDSQTPVTVGGIATATSITTGARTSCALLADQTVKCWGYNSQGELGNGSNTNSSSPQLVTGLNAVSQIASARGNHTCALNASGAVYCWGQNSYGQLGNGTTTDAISFQAVSGLSSGVTSIVAGGFGSCAKLTAGGAKCWGFNGFGQLGNGGTSDALTPVSVSVVSGIRYIDLGDFHACATLTAGNTKCWGQNSYGVLGINIHDGTYLTAQDPTSLSQDIVYSRSGMSFACALKASGSVYCWGKATYGQIGNSSFLGGTASTAKQSVSGLSSGVSGIGAGSYHSCAPMIDGTMKCWGSNSLGQLAVGTSMLGNLLGFDIPQSSIGSALVSVASGLWNSCSLDSSGVVRCWGANFYGQLGNATNSDSGSPVAVSGLSGAPIVQITSGGFHSCALKSTGDIFCWGRNDRGQLGNNTGSDSNTPQQVLLLGQAASQISAGYKHTCAVLTTGQVKCWGDGSYGNLGNCNTSVHAQYSPQSVLADSSCSSSLAGVNSVSSGGFHTCAVLSTGAVKCWGYNGNGQLGNNDNTLTTMGYPVQTTGITSGIAQVASGTWHTCALTIGGGVKCWGSNGSGQVGAGTIGTSYITYWDVPGLTTASALSAGRTHSCILTSSGGVKCWGSDFEGELGDGNAATVTPHGVSSLTLF